LTLPGDHGEHLEISALGVLRFGQHGIGTGKVELVVNDATNQTRDNTSRRKGEKGKGTTGVRQEVKSGMGELTQ